MRKKQAIVHQEDNDKMKIESIEVTVLMTPWKASFDRWSNEDSLSSKQLCTGLLLLDWV